MIVETKNLLIVRSKRFNEIKAVNEVGKQYNIQEIQVKKLLFRVFSLFFDTWESFSKLAAHLVPFKEL